MEGLRHLPTSFYSDPIFDWMSSGFPADKIENSQSLDLLVTSSARSVRLSIQKKAENTRDVVMPLRQILASILIE